MLLIWALQNKAQIKNIALATKIILDAKSNAYTLRKENAQLTQNQLGVPRCKSLTMSYFHTGIRTIIGAKSFHCPVRDGKEWYQLAMVIRHNFCVVLTKGQHNEFIEQISFSI